MMRFTVALFVLMLATISGVRRRLCPFVLLGGEYSDHRVFYVITYDGVGPLSVTNSRGIPRVGEAFRGECVRKCKVRSVCSLGGAMLSKVLAMHVVEEAPPIVESGSSWVGYPEEE